MSQKCNAYEIDNLHILKYPYTQKQFFLWTSTNLFLPIHSVTIHSCSMQCGTSWTCLASLVPATSVVGPVVEVIKPGGISYRHRHRRSSALPTLPCSMAHEEGLGYQPLEGEEILLPAFPGPKWMIKQHDRCMNVPCFCLHMMLLINHHYHPFLRYTPYVECSVKAISYLSLWCCRPKSTSESDITNSIVISPNNI